MVRIRAGQHPQWSRRCTIARPRPVPLVKLIHTGALLAHVQGHGAPPPPLVAPRGVGDHKYTLEEVYAATGLRRDTPAFAEARHSGARRDTPASERQKSDVIYPAGRLGLQTLDVIYSSGGCTRPAYYM